MSATMMTIDFELTRGQFLSEWKKHVAQIQMPWWSRVSSFGFLFLAIQGWGNMPWWVIGLEVVIAAQLWWMPRIVIWIVMKVAFWSRSTIQTRIEVDSGSVSVSNPEFSYVTRMFQWSKLSGMKETEFCIELTFKGHMYGVGVPWCAFRDAEQQAEFLQIAESHLPRKPDASLNEKIAV